MNRRWISITGVVQGVGFRPFVYDLATRHGLRGFVRNDTGAVWIEVEGEPHALERFQGELTNRPPPLARIDRVHWAPRQPRGDRDFRIESSQLESAGAIFVSPDVATCAECVRELFDPADRRYRYPFLNCTNCGPRLTIIRGAPYDRERTTMAAFVMCDACRAEYEDPRDRRFHAQPTACPRCGPTLQVLDEHGQEIATSDPLGRAIEALRQGRIVAVKGLGGYHLTCLAASGPVVAELRRRKQREEKPFAVMVRDVAAARELGTVTQDEEELLVSPRRPIVLLERSPAAAVAMTVAPGNPCLGVMLPYTPLHHLLLNGLGGAPLVVTSGNASDEPIAYEDRDANARLSGIADLFLTHDRPIHLRCDDSVTRVVAGIELPVRRSRGDAPCPLDLPRACPRPTLALGGQLKATFALGRGRHAFVSHHIGDLDHFEAYRAYTEAIRHYERLFSFRPEQIVHDLHPDYASTRYAWQRDDAVPQLAVQHHQAHIASCLADNGVDEPVIGVAFDGTGFGTDGAIWGGEFFVGDCRGFRRAAHLRYVAMPGGERAIREPWRMAAAYLADAGLDDVLLRGRVAAAALATVRQLIERRFNAPLTSSAGRLFDGVAALAGGRSSVTFEGQAAMELEWLAAGSVDAGAYPFEIESEPGAELPLVIDTRPLIAAVAAESLRGEAPARIARRFHTTVVAIVARVCDRLRASSGLGTVAVSGGVFLNAVLTREVVARLGGDGFRVLRHRRVPPNDGGLCLGQLALAAAVPLDIRSSVCPA
ncbi:MAG: carbamoyltransferase HypF [Isosphaeraceae bacterium]|nr:carbamoyltransferase HypF [Isosphaeraceae bacterium]